MNNTVNAIVGVAGWVLFILTLVASYYEYAKKSDPEVADKMKHVGTFAEWAVSLQDTLDKSNPEKLASATQDVLNQAQKSGIELTTNMAKGAVEKAVADRKPADEIEKQKQSLLTAPDTTASSTSEAVEPAAPAEPNPNLDSATTSTDEVHDLLDDLEVK
jgi:LL-H family phage holin